MPGISLNGIPLDGGPYEVSLATVRLEDIALHLCRCSPFTGLEETILMRSRRSSPSTMPSLVQNWVTVIQGPSYLCRFSCKFA